MSKGLKVFIKVIVCIIVVFLFIHFIGLPLLQRHVAAKKCREAFGPDFKVLGREDTSKSNDTQCGGGTQCKTNTWLCVNSEGEIRDLSTGQVVD